MAASALVVPGTARDKEVQFMMLLAGIQTCSSVNIELLAPTDQLALQDMLQGHCSCASDGPTDIMRLDQ